MVKPLVVQVEEARHLVENGNYEDAIQFLTQIIEVRAHVILYGYTCIGYCTSYVHGLLR